MNRAVRFYNQILGLRIKSESPHRSVFETGATKLVLHKGVERKDDGSRERHLEAGSCVLGFVVEDLEGAMSELKSRGVTFPKPISVRGGGRTRVAEFYDPDGFTISISSPVIEASSSS